ncbi:hypothetical protein [Jiella pacifica]|uniref:Uncharacterized protein n=1 Tax=Jiella pacifica TaxID=2696469 RepID=A0A6N9T604_9HYPH|nr:hypothetical protein [Jiella pacifica]NDW05199.1 hypothetical protein [Jiella pacifica]
MFNKSILPTIAFITAAAITPTGASAAMATALSTVSAATAAGEPSIGSRVFNNGGRQQNRRVEIVIAKP